MVTNLTLPSTLALINTSPPPLPILDWEEMVSFKKKLLKSLLNPINNKLGAKQYKSGSGNIYALEGNHWDITYY